MVASDLTHLQLLRDEDEHEEPSDHTWPQIKPAASGASIQIKRKPLPLQAVSRLANPESPPEARSFTRQSSSHQDSNGIDAVPASTAWTPLLLRRWTLVCFVSLLVSMIVMLETLYIISEKRNGLISTSTNLHYLWTYAPTAIFILITIYWRKVDFEAKCYQPWMDLAAGPIVASKTLLVDYFTPMPHTQMKDAAINRHFLILASFFALNLLTLITVFSTGLMDAQILNFDDTSLELRLQAEWGSNTSDWSSDWRVQAVAQSQITDVVAYRLPYTAGVNEQFAIQPVVPHVNLTNLGVQFYGGHIDVFALQANCQPANVYWRTTSFDSNTTQYSNISFVSPGCWFMMDPEPTEPLTNSSVQAHGSSINCADSDKVDTGFILTWIKDCGNRNYTFSNQTRLMITAYNCQGQALSLFNAVCAPSYNISATDVKIWSNGSIKHVDTASASNSRQLEGVSSWDLSVSPFYSSLKNWNLRDPIANTTLDGFVNYLLSTQANYSSAAFYNSTFLQTKMNYEVPRLAAQLAHLFYLNQDLTASSLDTIHGFVHVSRERLVFKTLPTYLVQGSLVLVLVCVLVMVSSVRGGAVPKSFGTIASIAAILADSPDLCRLLTDTGHLKPNQLQKVIGRLSFVSTRVSSGRGDGAFSITSHGDEADLFGFAKESLKREQEKLSIDWYRPMFLRYWALGILLFVTIAVIATLEVLLQTSQRKLGIVSVDPESSTRYLWLYIPTLILSLVNLTFGTIQFNLAFADAYFELSKKWSSADASVFCDTSKAWAPTLIVHGYRKSKWALVSASVSVIFAPLLTIIASGLFSVSPVTNITSASMDAATWIYPDPMKDFGLNAVAESIVLNNVSYPAGTYNELILPTLNTNAADQNLSLLTNVTIQAKVPALRAILDGHAVYPGSSINIFANGDACNFSVILPEECKSAIFSHSDNFCTWNYLQPGQYFAQSSMINQFQDAYSISVNEAYGPNCTVGMISLYGKMESDSTLNYTGYVWTTGLAILDATTTFSYPGLTIVTEPQIDEITAQRYSNWSPDANLGNLLHNYETGFTTTSLNDGVVQALINNQNGFSRDELMNPNIFTNAYQRVYRQYIAQALNQESRTPLAALNDSQSATVNLHAYPVNITHVVGQRLQQSAISTRLLQTVLAILAVCTIVVIFTLKIEKVMPKPIGSIAAVMSLLVGSQIANPKSGLAPPGIVGLSPKDMKKQNLWSDLEFRMWWFWDDEKPHNQIGGEGSVEGLLSSGERGDVADASDVREVTRPKRRFGIESRRRRTGVSVG